MEKEEEEEGNEEGRIGMEKVVIGNGRGKGRKRKYKNEKKKRKRMREEKENGREVKGERVERVI